MSQIEILENLALTFAVLVPFTTFTWLMSFSPQTIVRWQARFYQRIYKESRRLPDEEIDRLVQLPWDRALMGKRSEFIQRGIVAPESYTKLIRAYRSIGIIGWIMLGCTFATMLMAAVAQLQH